jgi:hypothetical protein
MEQITNTTTRARMWFGWSVQAWEAIFFWVTSAAALLGTVSLLAAFSSAIIGYKISDVVTRESSIEIANANARQKEAELKLGQLRRLAGPRGLNSDIFKRELLNKPKSTVEIWYLPDVSDGFWFATELVGALIAAEWPLAGPPIPFPDAKPDPGDLAARFKPRVMAAGGQPSGVTVVATKAPPDSNEETSQRALMMAIAFASSMQTAAGGFNTSVPEGTLRVIIAAKADPILPPETPDGPTNKDK